MDIRVRNSIIGVISIIIGVILIISIIPMMMTLYNSPLNIFLNPIGYLFLSLFVLDLILFLYAYFMIYPAHTARKRRYLAIGAIIIGGILVVLPVIGYGYEMIYKPMVFPLSIYYYFSFYHMPLLLGILLLVGAALTIHGFFLRKNLKAF